MKDKLLKLLQNSYSPYSNFRVACIVVMKDGKEFNGVNVENASFGATICAERNAIMTAISNGYNKNDFSKLYVMCNSEKISYPCFMCRQVMSELFDQETQIIIMNNIGREEIRTIRDICPYPFTDGDLE